MQGYIHVSAVERSFPNPDWTDSCGIKINGVSTLAYDYQAVPVNIVTLQRNAAARSGPRMLSLEGHLGALTVVPANTPVALGFNQDAHVPGFKLERQPLMKTSFMGIFHHHDIRFVLTPSVKLHVEESFKIEDRRQENTNVTFYQYSPSDSLYTEVSIDTPVKSLNFTVEESTKPELVRKYRMVEELQDVGIPAKVTERHLCSPEFLMPHCLFPDFDEDNIRANIGVCKAFEPSYKAFYDETTGLPIEELFHEFLGLSLPSPELSAIPD